MAANGGGPPFIKKEEEEQSDSHSNYNSNISFSNHHLHHHAHAHDIHNDECSNSKFSNNNGSRGISIAERRAAKCGFNASNMNAAALSQPPPPPLFTIPPSLVSPAALLDSPIMLPNAQAQQSPTTGTFQFPAPNHDSLRLKLKLSSSGDHTTPMETCSDSVEAPREEVQIPLSEPNKMTFMHENKEFEYPRNLQLQQKVECFDSIDGSTNIRDQHQMMMSVKRERGNSSLPNVNPHQKSGGGGGGGNNTANNNNSSSKNSEDGFYWRKYGQKHVKGSEYPRSYYKCTNTNCSVTKKVERSHDGHVTEIVYKGSHNHPNPQPLLVKREENTDFAQEAADYAHLERQPSSNFPNDFPDPFNSYQSPDQYTPAFGVQDPEQERLVTSPESEEDADDNGECEIKKRRKDGENSAAVARSTREPKIVVQIESEVDILDDGYRWRKYGQKVVKGNPNPRSYYKCTTPGCPVRKHVERAATDIKFVITTYEGKHNHEIPSGKTGNNANNHSSDQVASAAHAAAASSASKLGGDALKAPGKQAQDHLPMYLDRKPMMNYNGLMQSNNFSPDLNFGPSSLYPLPLPPFQSLPYGSFVMNTTKLYPMMPDYMSSQMNAPPGSSSAMPLASTYHYSTTTYAAHHQVPPSTRAQETRAVMPKEEQMRDEDELYDTCLSIHNQANGSM